MASKGTQRKLTAILCADVVGYSRLMGADEEATIETLTAYRKVFTSKIKKHRGRVVDAKGDAILAEFASVVDAVNGAVEIQRELTDKNAELPDDRRMDFRIGINLGDVVVKDDVIYGDGVNVAARLESLAEPGGICISRPVHDQVRPKLELEYEYLGEQQVKNIAEPVRAYRVRMDESESASPQAPAKEADRPSRLPAIAVLPLANMSNDPEQEYFSDGMTEDIITNLSKISRLSVTARNTVFTYKGKAVNVQQVGKELNVNHVLEGSVRKAGSRVRITAQLIDVSTGNHVWAERYDRELQDIFEVQDEITHHIVEALDVGLLDGEQARVWRQSTQNAEAYDYLLQGRSRWQSTRTRQGMIQARRLLEEAVALDGNFAHALANLAAFCLEEVRHGWSQSPQASMSQGFELVNRAIALDDSLAYAWGIVAMFHLENKEHDQALRAAKRGVSLNPVGANVNTHFARAQFFAGKHKQALATIRKAEALTPTPTPRQLFSLGLHCLWSGNLEEARAALKNALEQTPDSLEAHVILAATHAAQGQEAKREEQDILRIEPDFNLKEWVPRLFPFKDEADSERMMELLRKAGLPE